MGSPRFFENISRFIWELYEEKNTASGQVHEREEEIVLKISDRLAKEKENPNQNDLSAASKLAFFLYPDKNIHILDSKAKKSVSVRTGANYSRLNYDYFYFLTNCRAVEKDLYGQSHFRCWSEKAVKVIRDNLAQVQLKVSEEGLLRWCQRRFLDKVLFEEHGFLKQE